MRACSTRMDGSFICKVWRSSALLARYPTLSNLMITPLDRRPSDAEGDFLLARIAAIFVVGAVESGHENILRMRRQMVAHG